jgi:hypothetical protein
MFDAEKAPRRRADTPSIYSRLQSLYRKRKKAAGRLVQIGLKAKK